jgi:hypothetical protein
MGQVMECLPSMQTTLGQSPVLPKIKQISKDSKVQFGLCFKLPIKAKN